LSSEALISGDWSQRSLGPKSLDFCKKVRAASSIGRASLGKSAGKCNKNVSRFIIKEAAGVSPLFHTRSANDDDEDEKNRDRFLQLCARH